MYRLKKEKPHLSIETNGGIKTINQIDEHLTYVDSVMLGREIYNNPMIITEFGKYYNKNIDITKYKIVEKMISYVEKMEKNNQRPHLFLMHTHGLFHGIKGNKYWKRSINNSKADSNTLKSLLKEIKPTCPPCSLKYSLSALSCLCLRRCSPTIVPRPAATCPASWAPQAWAASSALCRALWALAAVRFPCRL